MKGEIGSSFCLLKKESIELLITFIECRRMKLSNLLELWKDRLLLLNVLLR